MEIDDVVKIINKKADLYEKISKELSNVISEINEEAKYRIDLFEEPPYLRIEIRGLRVNYKIKPKDILDEMMPSKNIKFVIIENIENAIQEIV